MTYLTSSAPRANTYRYIRLHISLMWNAAHSPQVGEVDVCTKEAGWLAPTMTGYSSPSPFKATASLDESLHEAYHAFDGNVAFGAIDNRAWLSGAAYNSPQWVEIDLGGYYTVLAVRIQAPSYSGARQCKDFIIYGHKGNFSNAVKLVEKVSESWPTEVTGNQVSEVTKQYEIPVFQTNRNKYRVYVSLGNSATRCTLQNIYFRVGAVWTSPAMNAPWSPYPYACQATSADSYTYRPYYAYTGSAANYWRSSNVAGPWYTWIELPNTWNVTGVRLEPVTALVAEAPKDITIGRWNGTSWDTVTSYTGWTPSSSSDLLDLIW